MHTAGRGARRRSYSHRLRGRPVGVKGEYHAFPPAAPCGFLRQKRQRRQHPKTTAGTGVSLLLRGKATVGFEPAYTALQVTAIPTICRGYLPAGTAMGTPRRAKTTHC